VVCCLCQQMMRKGGKSHASTDLASAHRARTRRADGDEARQARQALHVFLREYRHEIFDEEFQKELSEIYRESKLGRPPVPPARLALATILQAYTGVSDDEAMEAMVMDRRGGSWSWTAWGRTSRRFPSTPWSTSARRSSSTI
jgi:hypothetical protein